MATNTEFSNLQNILGEQLTNDMIIGILVQALTGDANLKLDDEGEQLMKETAKHIITSKNPRVTLDNILNLIPVDEN